MLGLAFFGVLGFGEALEASKNLRGSCRSIVQAVTNVTERDERMGQNGTDGCFAMLCYVFAMILLCFPIFLICFAMFFYVCYVLLCFAMFCYAFHVFAIFCHALLFF